MESYRSSEHGGIDIKVVGIVLLSLFFMAAGSLAIWLYFQYNDAKTNVDSKVTEAVATAVRDTEAQDEEKFLAREKEPNRTFRGPDDYGRLTFDYPKTWSVYQATDVSKGGGATYAAYFNPLVVAPIPANAQDDLIASAKATPSAGIVSKYAVRLKIKQKLYDDTLKEYEPLIKTGQITSQAFTNGNGVVGTRFDGRFNNDIRGVAIVVKISDKTLTIRADADVFVEDFLKLANTINFNQ